MCGYHPTDLLLAIADKSKCECGSVLDLADYQIEQYPNDIEVSAKYYCNACKRNKPVLKRLGSFLRSFWNQTKKVEITATGITYEKTAAGGE